MRTVLKWVIAVSGFLLLVLSLLGVCISTEYDEADLLVDDDEDILI